MKPLKLQKSKSIAYILACILPIAMAIIALQLTNPPKTDIKQNASTTFSVERAFAHIEQVAKKPHMSGTPEKENVCSYLAEELCNLGLEVDIQTATVQDYNGFPVFANVTNIVARKKGASSTKSVLIVGHYDTQPHTPGAADDGIAVGSMLEAARVVAIEGPHKNDIIFLFTDAEELGMLGAEAFASEHPWMADVGLVLNLEARGNRGTALAFEFSPQNGWAVKNLIKGCEYPFAGSMMYEIYRHMPNNTDFTVFKEREVSGFNVAIIEGFVNYHSATDTPRNLSKASLNHMGYYIMGTINAFGNIAIDNTKSDDLVFFNYLGKRMIYFPSSLNYWILAFIVLLFLFFLLIGFGRGYLSVGKILLSALFTLAAASISLGSAWCINDLVVKVYPQYAAFYMNNFYNVGYYFITYSIVAVVILALLLSFYTKYVHTYNLMASVFFIFIVATVIILKIAPTASYITFVPLLFGLISFIVLLVNDVNPNKTIWKYLIVMLLGVTPAIFLVTPYVKWIFVAFGLSMPHIALILLITLFLFAFPLFSGAMQLYRWFITSACLIAAAVVLIIAHIYSKPSGDRPLQSHVLYAALNDKDKAYWFSHNQNVDEWNNQFFRNAVISNASDFYPWRSSQMLKNDAEFQKFSSPCFEVVSDELEGGTRRLEFNFKSNIDAVIVDFIFRLSSNLTSVSVNGKAVRDLNKPLSEKYGHSMFRLIAPSFGGDNLKLEFDSNDSLSFNVIEVKHGLPKFTFIKPMPQNIIPSTGLESMMTIVKSNIDIDKLEF